MGCLSVAPTLGRGYGVTPLYRFSAVDPALNLGSATADVNHCFGNIIPRGRTTLNMALVSYSDSEGSEDEKSQTAAKHNGSSRPATQPPTNFAVDKSNPRKIQVKLQEAKLEASSDIGALEEESAPKRRRVGGGGTFSGFNSILPAPKRDLPPQSSSGPAKGQPRKVFSLKTGAERGFDRDSDAELKQLFAEQHADAKAGAQADDTNGASAEPSASAWRPNSGSKSVSIPSKVGSQTMFKPLSVARKPPKKKPSTNPVTEPRIQTSAPEYPDPEEIPKPTPKVSLFSTGTAIPTATQSAASTTDYEPVVYNAVEGNTVDASPDSTGEERESSRQVDDTRHSDTQAAIGPQTLDAVASDLNLSASARRQLFGRKSGASTNAVNVISFNTDKEYAANDVLRASGEQIQHNPVRGPSSGKHSLKQLVNMAAGQKDALEESFATGRQNKKEASSKYGW